MASIAGSFPHPVLGNQDDVSSIFELENVSYRSDFDDIEVKFRVINEDPDLEALISAGKAELKARWECKVTISSGFLDLEDIHHHHDGITYAGWLDQRLVRDEVDIEVFVIATEPLRDFSWKNQHSDYGGEKFEIRKGDLLADGGYFPIKVGKLFDPVDPPIGSCFRIREDQKLKKELKVDFSDDEQVIIFLPKDASDGLKELRDRPDLQISLLIMPALMETISFIQKVQGDTSDEDLDEKTWYRTLSNLIKSIDTESSPFSIAQKLLGGSLVKVLTDPLFPEEEQD